MATPVLDLSRSFSRLGHGAATGIDRVERAYLEEIIRRGGWGLIRTPRGFLLFEPDRLERLPEYLDRSDLDGADQASTIRAIASSRSSNLSIRKIMWRMPNGLAYINVGHTNLNPQTMRAMMEMPDHSKVVMIHDTIPIDHPEFQTETSRAKFVERLTTVINFANHIIVPSDAVRESVEGRMIGTGHRVPVTVSPLGVDLGSTPLDYIKSERPYFVILGTIEPRKNHKLLLEIWDRMNRKMDESRIPELRIIGARGWGNKEVFEILDNSPMMGRTVFELGPLSDREMKRHLAGATALLFPSLAEGYGFPPFEAATFGVPSICAPLRPTEIHLGDMAIYADTDDMYQWFQAIRELASEDLAEQTKRSAALRAFRLPTWERHFERVFNLL
ncbi:glycosyltransferase family 4 protein [Roseibium sp.]|uniref:glycosyltransferase family 4 protein n=1 Tax=Roseibium sp. TaxID=1936156 RepID=UPI003D0D32B9